MTLERLQLQLFEVYFTLVGCKRSGSGGESRRSNLQLTKTAYKPRPRRYAKFEKTNSCEYANCEGLQLQLGDFVYSVLISLFCTVQLILVNDDTVFTFNAYYTFGWLMF